MELLFHKKFSKDIDNIKDKKDRTSILDVIEKLEKANSLQELKGVKKLKGHKNAYRIRIGSLRIGVFLNKNSILLARVARRKDIYNLFP